MNRRDALKLAGISVATTAVSAKETAKKSDLSNVRVMSAAANLPKNGKGAKIVIVGGGWSGLSVAKRLKQYIPDADVVLVEQNTTFISCPISNLWLVGGVELEFITHSFLDAANNNGYTYFNASVFDIDRKKRKVYTNEGYLDYEYLVLAPGIDYDYSAWTNGDTALEYELSTKYPAGFKNHSEHDTIRRKIENFKEGNFLLTVPGGNYRCLPAPYERACLIADYMKKNKIKGKVVLMDENPDVTIKAEGFHAAFNEMYKDYLVYMPNVKIEEIDLKNKKVMTEFDEVLFSDAAFYPRVRGSKLLEIAGVAKDAINKGEANIDPFTYQVIGDPHVYCSGDSRPMAFSKSGNTSNSEGYIVARSIRDKILGQKNVWKSPHTECFSAVALNPMRAMSVNTDYQWSESNKSFTFFNVAMMQNWHDKSGTDAGKGLIEWGDAMYKDMFY
ncbi:MAG: FAD/NAD(P)-binding oxidoreductase [Sulfurimonas sp.]|uniref:FAD-dependent oxidoreductase n=1 Tax=Sulfurimonas sp. TaxID=2022749 RepID=UPI002622EA58|nr:FAD/NAD(P)-binding oxidoreductase [Sulfurimonas sp.]MDD3475964.1 FAD/NAD(P)-binding oxidoreductase [Sulfurimonas sp.]